MDPDLAFTINTSEPSLIYRSANGGESWISLPAPPGSQAINTIACDPADSDIVYVCRSGAGIFKSTNSGASWIDITNNLPHDPEYLAVSGIAINPLDSRNLYVSSHSRGNFVSHDGGQTWEAFNEGLDIYYYNAITIIPQSDTNRVYLATMPMSVWSITRTQTSIEDEVSPPDKFVTLSNYPNPFNAATTINFTIYNTEHITLAIYNLLGQHVETIYDGLHQAGQYSVIWDASDHPSGVYFARLKTTETEKNIKMVLLK